MKPSAIAVAISALLWPALVLADPSCSFGNHIGNPHCKPGPVVPATHHAGHQPPTQTNPPTQVGGIQPDIHNSGLVSADRKSVV